MASAVAGVHSVQDVEVYAIELLAGDYIEVELTQQHADLALAADSPAGIRLLRVDTPGRLPRPELLLLHARKGGRYRIQVDGGRADAAGPFELELKVRRPATAADQRRAEAARLLASSEEDRRASQRCSRRELCEGALPAYRQAVEGFRALGEAESEGFAEGRLGRVLVALGRPAEALASFERRLALLPPGHEPEERAAVLREYGQQLWALGNVREAELRSREALALFLQLGRPAETAEVLDDLGRYATHRGDLGEAERLYREAAEAWQALGRPRDKAIGLGNLSGVYLLAGDRRLALDLCDQALELLPAEASPADRAFLLEQRATTLTGLGQWDAAEESYRQALALREQRRELGARAHALAGLARLAYERRQLDRAASLYRDTLSEHQATRDLASQGTTLQDLAWVEAKRGELEAARARFEEALGLARHAELRWAEAAALLGLARVERDSGRLPEALLRVGEAIEAVEGLRAGAERLELRSAVAADKRTFYDVAIDLSLRQAEQSGDREAEVRAFGWAEQARGRRLLDLLASDAGPPCEAEANREARWRVENAERTLRALRAEGASGLAVAGAERELRSALSELQQLAPRPGRPGEPDASRPESLASIQRYLASSQAVLLAYYLGEERSVVWTVTPSALSTYALPKTAELEPQLRELHALLSASGWRAQSVRARKLTEKLSRELLLPAGEALASRRLLIVADGLLQYLPFEALLSPGSSEPLVAGHEIAYALSASAAVRLGAARRDRVYTLDLALLADPVFGPSDSRRALPAGWTSAPASLASPTRGESAVPELPRLKAAEREARAIAARLPPGRLLQATGFAATKELLASAPVSGARRIHLAVHGQLEDRHPELSSVVLSQLDPLGAAVDGTFYAQDLACLDLAAELVVLSACDTGLGAELVGEGLVGLAHGFFGAGAKRVLATLWQVDDAATAELMDRFYTGLLGQDLPPAEALRQAQDWLRRRQGRESPFFWAGFVLLGGH